MPSTPPAEAWAAMADNLRNPDIELDSEVFAGLWQAFQRARRAGVTFDRTIIALMTLLSRQALRLDDGLDDVAGNFDDLLTIGGQP